MAHNHVPRGVRTTEEMIEAVLSNRPSGPAPAHLLTGRGGRGLGAIVATTVGKIGLCTAVAAASVGGVYATTDRIEIPIADQSDESGPIPATSEPPSDPPASDAPTEETVTEEVEIVGVEIDASDGARVVADFVEGLEDHGCEFGQAVAEFASAGAAENRQNSGRGVDPCDRAAENSADAGPPEGRPANGAGNSDHADEAQPGRPDGAASDGPGRPENPGNSGGAGRP